MPRRESAADPAVMTDGITVGMRVQTKEGYPGRVTAINDGSPSSLTFFVTLDNGQGGGEYSPREVFPLTAQTAATTAATERTAADDYAELTEALLARPPLRHTAELFLPLDSTPEANPDSLHRMTGTEDEGWVEGYGQAMAGGAREPSRPGDAQWMAGYHLGWAEGVKNVATPPDGWGRTDPQELQGDMPTHNIASHQSGDLIATGGLWDLITGSDNPSKNWSPGRSVSYDWCRFRRDSHCYYAKTLNEEATKIEGYSVWNPEDRGYCPHVKWKDQEHVCQLSEPGPHVPGGFSDATIPYDQGGFHRSSLRDPEMGFHVTATWREVQLKAKRIRDEGGVRIVSSHTNILVAQVQGDTHIYQVELVRRPGSRLMSVAQWSCFLPDAPVLMADGTERPIESISVGDEVVTHLGNTCPVTRAEPKPYVGDLVRLKMAGDFREVVATADHQMWAANRDFGLQGRSRDVLYKNTGTTLPTLVPRTDWAEIGTLKTGDYLSQAVTAEQMPLVVSCPRPARRPVISKSGVRGVSLYQRQGYSRWSFKVTENGRAGGPSRPCYFDTFLEAKAASDAYYAERDFVDIKIDADLAKLIGWYTAEGFLVKKKGGYQVGFSLSSEERDVAEMLDDICWHNFGVRGSIRQIDNKLDYRVSNWRLYHLLGTLVGSGAHAKVLAPGMLTLPLPEQEAFLRGVVHGDGAVERENSRTSLHLVNETLIRQIGQIAARLGHHVGLGVSLENKGGLPTTQNAGPIYHLRWSDSNTDGRVAHFFRDGQEWRQIQSVEREHYDGQVWDIEVAGDHSFRAYGVNVHNCGCAWAAYSWGRTRQWRRFEGRQCSHALAAQWEAQSRGMFGHEVVEDNKQPAWMDGKPVKEHGDWSRDLGRMTSLRPVTAALTDDEPDVSPAHLIAMTMLDEGADIKQVAIALAEVGVADPGAIIRQAESVGFWARVHGAMVRLFVRADGVFDGDGKRPDGEVIYPTYHPTLGLDGVSYSRTAARHKPTLHLLHDDDETALRMLREHHGLSATATMTDIEFGKAGLHAVVADEGFTVHDHFGDAPGSGFMVSIIEDAEHIIPMASLTATDIGDYRKKYAHALADPDTYLGAWVFEGNCYLDISHHVQDRAAAITLAKQHHQLGIFDLSTFTTIDTSASGSDYAKAAAMLTDEWGLYALPQPHAPPKQAPEPALPDTTGTDEDKQAPTGRQAMRTFSPAERAALIEEGIGSVASNLERLDIVGTHYESQAPPVEEDLWGLW